MQHRLDLWISSHSGQDSRFSSIACVQSTRDDLSVMSSRIINAGNGSRDIIITSPSQMSLLTDSWPSRYFQPQRVSFLPHYQLGSSADQPGLCCSRIPNSCRQPGLNELSLFANRRMSTYVSGYLHFRWAMLTRLNTLQNVIRICIMIYYFFRAVL